MQDSKSFDEPNIDEKFLQLLRFAIHAEGHPPRIETEEWRAIFDIGKKQSVLGVLFEAVRRMGKDATIPRQLKMNWFFLVNKIRTRNMLLNQKSAELVQMFRKDGLRCCVLKGQGNAMMYPDPFLRSSGDIDLQVEGGMDRVLEYVRKRFPHTKTAYQHVDYPVFKNVPVEVHYLPSYLNNPMYNQRLKTWFDTHYEDIYAHEVIFPDGVRIPVPTLEFNIVFQLAHLMHHFFDEGIGLRQMIDYYYLLMRVHQEGLSLSMLPKLLDYLGLRKFAGAVMYIMHDVLGMEERFLIVPVDKRRGETLLNEIQRGGNFGKYSGLTDHSLLSKHLLKYWRTIHYMRQYPAEALCEPVFRTWHYFWRRKHS